MTSIQRVFSRGKAFIPFLTVGNPDIETSRKLIKALAEGGASLIELGIPFSDPMAEGEVIQGANKRGLEAKVTTDNVFSLVRDLRNEGFALPLAIMTYANVPFSYGLGKFFSKMKEADISFLILPDVPFEEKREFSVPAAEYGISVISLIAPTSEKRIEMIARDADGFIYLVSSLGVTGMRKKIDTDVMKIVRAIKDVRPDIPVAIGFGISDKETARKMAMCSDGIIIGSRIVKIIEEKGKDSVAAVYTFAREIREAIGESIG